jgi:hypothetical protein
VLCHINWVIDHKQLLKPREGEDLHNPKLSHD